MSANHPIFNVVIGTAGHIDHGKSTLVQTLTGIHPDRLKEEQERGITIDLGFAPLDLQSGIRVGIIDVPGHERFIKNMVAGASGIDFVIMVIAADDGVMAQTREHLQIVQLLGVRDGMTVITKKDLVEPDYLKLVIDDIRELEKDSMLADKPLVAVSSKTGEGIPELRTVLEKTIPKVKRREGSGPFRMPIQRVFAKEGFGTVVTGVPVSGNVALGDSVEVLPPRYSGRIKGLHAYQAVIDRGQAGHSTAMNLHGPEIDKRAIVRGMVAATPGVFEPTKLLTAQLLHLSNNSLPLKHRAPVRFHAGTSEIQGKVLLLEGDVAPPGQTCWVQILLEEPTVAAPGDHYILRRQSPMVTIGGGRIVDVTHAKRKRNDAEVIHDLAKRLTLLDNPEQFIRHILDVSTAPRTTADLCAESGQLPQSVLTYCEHLEKAGHALALRPGAVFISPTLLTRSGTATTEAIREYLSEHPALGGIERPELKSRFTKKSGALSAAYFEDWLVLLGRRNVIKLDSNLISPPGRERKLEGALAATAQKVEDALKAGRLAPPTLPEVQAQFAIAPKTFKEIVRFLVDTRALVEASPEIYFHREAFDHAKTELATLFDQKNERTTSEIRQHLGMNRKYVIPLVELLDRVKFTQRIGDLRKRAQQPV